MKLVKTANGSAYILESDEVVMLDAFLDPSITTVGYDVETYLTKLTIGKNGKPLSKQPGHNPWNAKTRLHQFYNPTLFNGIPVMVDTKNTDMAVFRSFLDHLFWVRDDVRVYAHYAIFDGSFVFKEFGVFPKNLYCTQIQSQIYFAGLFKAIKITERVSKPFTLAACYKRIFGGDPIDKTLQSSDWSGYLDDDQIVYAGNDVVYCHDLGVKMKTLIDATQLDRVEYDEQCGLRAFIFARVKGQVIDIAELYKLRDEYQTVVNTLEDDVTKRFSAKVMTPETLDKAAKTFKQFMKSFAGKFKHAEDLLLMQGKTNPNIGKISVEYNRLPGLIKTHFTYESYMDSDDHSVFEILLKDIKKYSQNLFNCDVLKHEKDLKTDLMASLNGAIELIYLTFGFIKLNPNSPSQMVTALNRIGLAVTSTNSKLLSSLVQSLEDQENFEDMLDEISESDVDTEIESVNVTQRNAMDALMLYRSVVVGLRYLVSMIDSYNPDTGCVHGEFRPMASQGTGRSSCGKPTLQIIPRLVTSWKKLGLRAIREAFKNSNDDWSIASLDSAGCHVQIARTYSQCPTLIKIVNEELDPYITLGVEILKLQGIEMTHDEIKKIIKDKDHPKNYFFKEQRQIWKKVFLSRLNGAGGYKIYAELISADPPIKNVSVDQCKEACQVFDQTFYGLAATQKALVQIATSYDVTSPFGYYENYTTNTVDGDSIVLSTNRYGIAKCLDGRRFFVPITINYFDPNIDPTEQKAGCKPTEVLAASWQGVEASCVKRAAYETVIWLLKNKLDDRAWLCNINHDEKVLTMHNSIALEVTTKAHENIEWSFRRYVPDYIDRVDPKDKIVKTWAEKD